MDSKYKRLFSQAKKNAKRRGIGWDLSESDCEFLVKKSKGKCQVSGIAFDFRKGESSRRPWSPSLDRIKSSKGYSAGNVRLVCVAVNYAMNEWGESVLRVLARQVCKESPHLEENGELSGYVSVDGIRAELLRVYGMKRSGTLKILLREIEGMVCGVDYIRSPCNCVLFREDVAQRVLEKIAFGRTHEGDVS